MGSGGCSPDTLRTPPPFGKQPSPMRTRSGHPVRTRHTPEAAPADGSQPTSKSRAITSGSVAGKGAPRPGPGGRPQHGSDAISDAVYPVAAGGHPARAPPGGCSLGSSRPWLPQGHLDGGHRSGRAAPSRAALRRARARTVVVRLAVGELPGKAPPGRPCRWAGPRWPLRPGTSCRPPPRPPPRCRWPSSWRRPCRSPRRGLGIAAFHATRPAPRRSGGSSDAGAWNMGRSRARTERDGQVEGRSSGRTMDRRGLGFGQPRKSREMIMAGPEPTPAARKGTR